MTYKEALMLMMQGKTVVNNEAAPNQRFKFDRRTHGIKMFKGSCKVGILMGPKAFADLDRTTNNWHNID